MTCGFSAARRAQIEARIERWEAQLEAMYDAFDALAAHDIEEYWFDSGEGKQRVTKKDAFKFQKAIDNLERKIDHWTNRLGGRGLVYHDVRRRG
jgi:uncharacterized protein Yka (UPF0111/DUF47 family)